MIAHTHNLDLSRVLFIFIDGLGIGARDEHNPLHLLGAEAEPLAVFEAEDAGAMMLDGVMIATDATLGIDGRPQSASGQTTILTGLNVPRLLGLHKHGFPNAAMRELLDEHSIFKQLLAYDVQPVTFANAYSPKFFTSRPRWLAATTVAVKAAGLSFRTLDDARAGEALYHDWSNKILIAAGEDVPAFDAEQAADVLVGLSRTSRFTLYEYFLTDRAGHGQDIVYATTLLRELARFVRAVIERIDLSRTTVIITSDHGNIEDLSTRNHTRNPVPTLAWGLHRDVVKRRVRTLADITPTIVEILTRPSAA
ncbi:MAG: hypothetical protein MSG64_00815 [Pyrinomonadaceae bacterium MAG19_C2-C3]|nr:hypothetical protein [Pyrinomonadaceae bacterium MAG19_C2-C3]